MKKLSFLLCCFMLMLVPNMVHAETYVAQIGENQYTTLDSAVSAAVSGQTIKILRDVSGSNLTLNSGITLDIPVNVTLSLTGNNKVNANAIIKNNGIIVIDDGCLDISKLTYGNNGLIPNQDGLMSVKDNGKVIMLESWEGAFAPSNSSTILTATENGAKMTVGENNYIYKDGEWIGAFQVGENYYTTLSMAGAAITTSGTITLLTDVDVDRVLTITGKTITVEMNGYNIDADMIQEGATKNWRVFKVGAGGVLTVNNSKTTGGIINVTGEFDDDSEFEGINVDNKTGNATATIGANVTIKAGTPVTLYGNSANGTGTTNIYGTLIMAYPISESLSYASIQGNGSAGANSGVVINVYDGAKIINDVSTAIFAPQDGTINIYGGEIIGKTAIAIKSGHLNVSGGTIKATGPAEVPEAFSNGVDSSGAAIQIESNDAYFGEIEVNITGGNIISENGAALYEYLKTGNADSEVLEMKISGGTFTSGENVPAIMLSNELFTKNTSFISGGKFSTNPSAYIKAGYKLSYADSYYEVVKVNVVDGDKTISGTITNGEGAIIQLKQGNTVLKAIQTEDGEYSISKVLPGVYNLVFINGEQTVTKLIVIKDANLTVDVTIPLTGSTVFNFVGDSFDVVVGGLDEVSPGNEVEFNVVLQEVNADSEVQTAIKSEVVNKSILFFDMEMFINDDNVSEINNVLQIVIPFDFDKKDDIELLRSHDGVISKFNLLTSLPTDSYQDQTYYLDKENGLIYVYANKFSTYAVAYKDGTINPQTSDGIGLYFGLGLLSVISLSYFGLKTKNKFN
ncbi:MAG: carboxypeptidase-like regulatory domain-containing protein [bacterium]|nr:carboxypeptidase-like regulatory domain-containing protein [bacterium]